MRRVSGNRATEARLTDMSRVVELFGLPTSNAREHWSAVVQDQACPFLADRCVKVRKSQPHISIGTCTVAHGRSRRPLVVCPHRLIQNSSIFVDCIHLLDRHKPGNEFHLLSEVSVPGGTVDYFLVSARNRKVDDFVAIEIQTLDTTGTAWPERQRFLRAVGVATDDQEHTSERPFGINWKMSAKTILVQLHHKIETFESIGKHLVLVVQDAFLEYMQREFVFDHIKTASPRDALQFHSYAFQPSLAGNRLQLAERLSTDADGAAKCLGFQTSRGVDLDDVISTIERRMTDDTVLNVLS